MVLAGRGGRGTSAPELELGACGYVGIGENWRTPALAGENLGREDRGGPKLFSSESSFPQEILSVPLSLHSSSAIPMKPITTKGPSTYDVRTEGGVRTKEGREKGGHEIPQSCR